MPETKEANGVQKWWGGLDKNQQAALTGSLVGGGTFGAVNMLRQGKKNRFKNFLGGVAAGGLGGAAIGYGGSKMMNAKPPKVEEKPGVPKADQPAPTKVDATNFVGTGAAPSGPLINTDRVESAAGGAGRRALRGVGGAAIGANAAPLARGAFSFAKPRAVAGWHNWTAGGANSRAAEFGKPIAGMVAKMRGMTVPRVLAGPDANAALTAAAKRLGSTEAIELAKRLKAHGGMIDMKYRNTDPFLRKLHGQLTADVNAQRATAKGNVNYYRTEVARAQAEAAAAKAKATASMSKAPTFGAAAKGGYTGKTNLLGLGKMRNPVLGAVLGGGAGFAQGDE